MPSPSRGGLSWVGLLQIPRWQNAASLTSPCFQSSCLTPRYLAIAIRRLRIGGRAALRNPALVAVLAGAVLALVAALFSLPPSVNVFGLKVAMPSGIVYLFTSTWRVFSRFVELLELGLCIMMAFGISRLLAGRRPRTAVIVTAVLAVVLVVDLWAPWCGPCRMIGPIVEQLSEEYEGKALITKCDVDENSEIAVKFGIRNIPTLVFLKNGQLVDKIVGAAQKTAIKEKLDAML